MFKCKTLLLALLLTWLFACSQAYASSFIVKNDNANLYYGCPFDVDIYIDAQWEDIMGASIDISLLSWLSLEAYAFSEMFNLQYPYMRDTGSNTYKIFTYKFPWVFSWVQKFVTLRLSQNENVLSNRIFFIADESNYSSNDSWTSIFYLWWKNSLTSIQNSDFVFLAGDCPSLVELSGDIMKMSQSDLLHKASAIIDQFADDQDQPFREKYSLYIMISWLILLLIIIVFLCVYFGKKKK